MFNNQITRVSLGVMGASMVVSYLGAWFFLWVFTFGLLFLLGLVPAFLILGRLGADAVAFYAVWHLFKTLRGRFAALKEGSL